MKQKSRTRRILDLVVGFFVGQAALQGISVLTSLYLVRTLSIDSYAQYGLALGFQSTTTVLMDLGYASTIIPLVGERVSDKALVGRYVRGAKSLRDRAYWILAPVLGVIFIAITYRQHWPSATQLLLLASILLSLHSSGPVSYFSVPLFLSRRLRAYYLPQTLAGFFRLVLYVVLGGVGYLSSWMASALSALNVTINGYFLGRESKKEMDWPKEDDLTVRKEIRRYVLPAIPAILLGAFQGQIALFLISIFGSTVNIAQVAALGRLGQLFAVLMTFNVVVVEPYVARVQRDNLVLAYIKLILIAVLGCVGLVLIAYTAPGIFLWLLGPKYEPIRGLIGLVVLTACINYVAGLIWIMNRSRKWIFWRGTIAEISILAIVQVGFLATIGVRDTRTAVLFSFASSFCYLGTHIYVAVIGFNEGINKDAVENAPTIPLPPEGLNEGPENS